MYFRAASSGRRETKPSIPVESGETGVREEGVILKLCEGDTYGFIRPNNKSHGDIFFHRNNVVKRGSALSVNDRVQFRVSEDKNGRLEASDIFVQVSVDQHRWQWRRFELSLVEVGERGFGKGSKMTKASFPVLAKTGSQLAAITCI